MTVWSRPFCLAGFASALIVLCALPARASDDLVAPETPPWKSLAARVVHTFSGVQYVVLKPGTGPKPVKGQVVQMHYVGRLSNGTVYSSSYARQTAIHFKAGTGYAIPGWDEMVMDMRKGERRVALIPPELAYGDEGFPGEIPPRETLTIDMELLELMDF